MIHQQKSKSTSWNKALVLTSAIFLTAGSTFVQAQAGNFFGSWNLNEGKSNLGQFARMAARKMNVKGNKDSVTVERFSSSPDGNETSYTDHLTFDGKETETTLFGSSKKKSTAKWSDDGKTMNVNSTIFFDRDGQVFEIKVTEVWKLSEDGKALTIASTTTSQMGTNDTSLYFDKAG